MTLQSLRADGFKVEVAKYQHFVFVVITSPDGVTSTAYAGRMDGTSQEETQDLALDRAMKKLRDGGDTF